MKLLKPMVQIKWLDARDADGTWLTEKEATAFGEELCEIISIGFLISKTDKYVTIGGDFNLSDNDYSRVGKIPSVWVTDLIEVPLQSQPDSPAQ